MKKILVSLLKAVGTTIGLMFLWLLIELWSVRFGKTGIYYRTIPFYLINIVIFYVLYTVIAKLKIKARCEGQGSSAKGE